MSNFNFFTETTSFLKHKLILVVLQARIRPTAQPEEVAAVAASRGAPVVGVRQGIWGARVPLRPPREARANSLHSEGSSNPGNGKGRKSQTSLRPPVDVSKLFQKLLFLLQLLLLFCQIYLYYLQWLLYAILSWKNLSL